jgi:endogenous inhibitor of DNA gyrase (YacG/DUF329 family)
MTAVCWEQVDASRTVTTSTATPINDSLPPCQACQHQLPHRWMPSSSLLPRCFCTSRCQKIDHKKRRACKLNFTLTAQERQDARFLVSPMPLPRLELAALSHRIKRNRTWILGH